MPTTRPPTVTQRVVCGFLGAVLALSCCGLPNAEKQPTGLFVWTACGAIFGAASAGTMTRGWRDGQSRKKLRGPWLLVEEDAQVLSGGEPRRLVLKYPSYEEWIGGTRDVKGACWTDAMTDPLAISFTPKTDRGAGVPRPGIYRLEGKVLTICLACPGLPRPTEFRSIPDIQQLRVYQRASK
jgi:uncharacterized protein (TIGR03067 family)